MSIVLTETSMLCGSFYHTLVCAPVFWNTVIYVLRNLWATLGIQWVILLERYCIIMGWTWAGSNSHLGCPHVVDHTCWHEAIRPAGLHGHGLSFTVKPWASRGILAMYERSCHVLTWSKPHHRTFCSLSLTACLVMWSYYSFIRK